MRCHTSQALCWFCLQVRPFHIPDAALQPEFFAIVVVTATMHKESCGVHYAPEQIQKLTG